MQRRITDFITYVAGLRGNDDDGQEEVANEEEEVDRATDGQLTELREQTEEIFKHLFWTRVVAVHDYQVDTQKSWPIAPDLSDEYDHMFTVAEDELPELVPHFDHVAFSRLNPQPRTAAWKLNKERLEELMNNVIRIRDKIGGEVDRLREAYWLLKKKDREQDIESATKLSTRACNPEGLLEKDLRAREREDQFPCFHYKKRKLYQLTSDEIDAIINSCQKEHLT